MTRRNSKCLPIALALAWNLIAGSHVMAALTLHVNDVVTATLTPGTSIMGTGATSLALYADGTHASQPETWNSSQGGLLGWTQVTVQSDGIGPFVAAQDFYSSCIEVLQNVYWNSPATWTVVDLSTAPRPTDLNGDPGGMQGTANYIEQLYRNDYSNALTGGNWVGAFQMAVWKLVYDGTGAGVTSNPNFTTGRLTASGPVGQGPNDPGSEIYLAEQMLSGLTAASSHPDVVALTSPNYQDQIYFAIPPAGPLTGVVPEPSMLVTWGLLGALGLAYRRRRRLP